MKQLRLLSATIVVMLLLVVPVGCATPTEESAELQPRGNGTAELVTNTAYEGTYSAKLAIPEDYTWGDAARVAFPLVGITLNDVTSLSFWCYIDTDTPVNPDGRYWVPYVTFELDTDGQPGCDTWVIGGGGSVAQSSGVWFRRAMVSDWLFHVSSVVADYESPFPLSDMGTLTEIKAEMGPEGKTSLGDYTVSKIRLAIGDWGPGGPVGPVICYVDYLMLNGELVF